MEAFWKWGGGGGGRKGVGGWVGGWGGAERAAGREVAISDDNLWISHHVSHVHMLSIETKKGGAEKQGGGGWGRDDSFFCPTPTPALLSILHVPSVTAMLLVLWDEEPTPSNRNVGALFRT